MKRQNISSFLVLVSLAFPLNQCAGDEPANSVESAIKLHKLGRAYLEEEKYQEAIEAFDKSLEHSPHIKTYVARARVRMAIEDYELAIADLDQAIEIDPKFLEAFCWRGVCSVETKNLNQAIADYTTAISLSPDQPGPYLARAMVWLRLDNDRLAISDLDKAIELSPDTAELYLARGTSFASLENWNESIKNFDKALEINPQFIECYVTRGVINVQTNHYSEAIDDLEHAVELDPKSADTVSFLVKLLTHCQDESIRDYPRAVKLAEKACELTNWNDHRMVCLLAMSHSKKGDAAEANKWLEKAIQIAPADRKDWVRQNFEDYHVKVKSGFHAQLP